MLSFFRRKKRPNVNIEMISKAATSEGYLHPLSAHELLNTVRRQKLINYIWQRTSVSRQQFDLLYLKPIERYAELVQLFPASESHHHAYQGGMLDHGLEIVAYGLKLRQSYLLPIGSSSEEQAAQEQVWSAGVAYAALLHDIGKLAVDLHVEYDNGQRWYPWHGALVNPYKFKYVKGREYKLHSASTGLLYHQILDASILDWLNQTPDLFASVVYVLAGQFQHAGVLGDIVTKADQASVAQELGGDPSKAMAAPKHALQRKLLDGLRYLIKEELKLNNTGPSDGWLTEDALWLVSKTVSDKLRAHLLSQGIAGIPAKNSAIFDIMQEHSILLPTKEGKAIWNAEVQADGGWSMHFTFLKISPVLIWENNDDRPEVFNGHVTVTFETEAHGTTIATVNEQALAVRLVENTTPEGTQLQADSLDVVFQLLDMDVQDATLGTHENALETHETTTLHDSTQEDEAVISKPTKRIKGQKPLLQTQSTVATTALEYDVITAKDEESPVVPELAFTSDIMPSGEHFMVWLKQAILQQKLTINEPKALVHTLSDSIYIITPGIFMRYSQEYPQVVVFAKQENIPAWRWVQKQFEKLKVHKKQPDGLNIWTCKVIGPRNVKKVHGYILNDPTTILPEIMFNNPYLEVCEKSVES